MTFKLEGIDQMVSKLRQIQSQFPERVMAALYQEAQIEMTESKRRVPVDTGKLRNTGHVEEPTINGTHVSVKLGYHTEYAIPVHENPDAFHPVGQWKYLESVLNESRAYMAARLARRLKL